MHVINAHGHDMKPIFFQKLSVFIMERMVYVKVVFGVQVNWRINPHSQKGNVLAYRSGKFVVANPLTCPKNVPIPIRVPLVHKA